MYFLNKHPIKQKPAFSLAETLVTLLIIGVVAAITLPLINNSFQEQSLKASFKKEYSTLLNAHQQVTTDNGGLPYNCYYGLSDECSIFWTKIKEKLNIVDDKTSVDISDIYTGWDSADFSGTRLNLGCNGGFTALLPSKEVITLADGAILISYGNLSYSIGNYFFLDVNGFKKPNKWGYDIFSLNWGNGATLTNKMTFTDNTCGVYETGGYRVSDMLK